MRPIDPRELAHDANVVRRFGQFIRPSPNYRKPVDPTMDREPDPSFTFILKPCGAMERELEGPIDQHLAALIHANQFGGVDVFGRFDCERDGIVLAKFRDAPRNVRAGFVEAAWPLAPSIVIRVPDGGIQAVWLYRGVLPESVHKGLAERLIERLHATRVVTRGPVDLRWGGFFIWSVPEQPRVVLAEGNEGMGEAAGRYSAGHMAGLARMPTDSYAA